MTILKNYAAIPATLLLLLGAFVLLGCDEGSGTSATGSPAATPSPTSVRGAWLGKGTFNASAGSTPVVAQLEVLKDGTYRFLIIEPRILALAGMETGTWTHANGTLELTPDEEKPATPNPETGEKPSLMDAMRAGSPRELREKTLHVAQGFSSMSIDDEKMKLRFEPNPDATAKLQAAGDI